MGKKNKQYRLKNKPPQRPEWLPPVEDQRGQSHPPMMIFMVPLSDDKVVGKGWGYEVWIRIYLRGVKWKDNEGFRVWCVAGLDETEALQNLRTRAKGHDVTRVELYDVRPPKRTKKTA